MLRISKSIATLWIIGIVIIGLLIGLCIGYVITPSSIVKTETKVVTEPCKYVDLNNVGLLEQSVIHHCDECNDPAQRILYDPKNEITYIYTYYYEYREGYSHHLELRSTDIIKIYSDGTLEIIK